MRKALLTSEGQIHPGGAGGQRDRASPEPAQGEEGLECKKKRCKGIHRQKIWEEGEKEVFRNQERCVK